MNETTYYVIGDVHGYYDKLMRVVAKLPEDARLVFVGDLIDRGPHSAEVVAFVREGSHLCVRGNHEAFMIAQRPNPGRPWRKTDLFDLWMENGGRATLASYGLRDDETLRREENAQRLQSFYDDIAWMRTLPYYLELEGCSINGRRVVVSHSSVARVWGRRFTNEQMFNEYVIINRDPPEPVEGIFNVFGHSPFRTPKLYGHAARIDTGPYLYGVLSALEMPSLRVVNSEA